MEKYRGYKEEIEDNQRRNTGETRRNTEETRKNTKETRINIGGETCIKTGEI